MILLTINSSWPGNMAKYIDTFVRIIKRKFRLAFLTVYTFVYMKNTMGVLLEAGSAYLSWAPGFIPGFWWGPCFSSLWISVLYVLFCLSLFCVLCNQCCQCLWVVHSWLPLRFSLTFSFCVVLYNSFVAHFLWQLY